MPVHPSLLQTRVEAPRRAAAALDYVPFQRFDYVMLLVLGMILTLGAAAIFSAAAGGPLFVRQFGYIGVGAALMLIVALTDYHRLGRWYLLTFVVCLLLLLSVRQFGHVALGAQRWISLGFFDLQPAEIAKLLIIIVLGRFLADRERRARSWLTFVGALALILPPLALIILQPDLGTSLVFIAIFYGMAFMAGVAKRYLLGSIAAIAVAIPLITPHLHGYQQKRLEVFLNPALDPQGAGYNLLQAKIAVGSGGFFGKGFLTGTQGQLGFVPSRVTDFIFAIFSEEFGFFGALILLGLFLVLLLRLVRVTHLARDHFGLLLASGILTMLFAQVVINVGMNLGVMPVVGIPLPFISYGGSSMLTNMIAIGIVQSILIRRQAAVF
jgi:rod shape determining protein RodA